MTAGDGAGVLLDYGGVLTPPVPQSFAAFEAEHGIAPGRVLELLIDASRDDDGGIIGAIERGELTDDDFDGQLRQLLHDAGDAAPDGAILDRLFAGLRPAGPLWQVARRARSHGIRVGLLSNSWGTGWYPHDRLVDTFDVRVISGEVGLRKPDPAIYQLALDRLGVAAERTAFVDDLPHNVEAAEALGMRAILHEGDDRATIAALEAFLGVPLDPKVGETARRDRPSGPTTAGR